MFKAARDAGVLPGINLQPYGHASIVEQFAEDRNESGFNGTWTEGNFDGTLLEGRGDESGLKIEATAKDLIEGDPILDAALTRLRSQAR